MVMDLVIVYVEPYFSILLSRYFGSTLGGTIQFTTIPMPKDTIERLYKEPYNRVVVKF